MTLPLIPPAKIWQRTLGFFMDMVLIFLLGIFIIGKLILPAYYSEQSIQLQVLFNAYMNQSTPQQNLWGLVEQIHTTPLLSEMLVNVDRIFFLITWLYFFVSEYFFQGSSLGKQVFNLKILKLATLTTPSLPELMLRAGIKTFCLFTLWPLLLIINGTTVFFNPLKRALHDCFCQTYVIHNTETLIEKANDEEAEDNL